MSVHNAETRSHNLARSTLIVIIAFAAAKAISLAQVVVIGRTFGLSSEYDAFVAANKLPEQIYTLIAGGAIAFAFIPVFTGLLATDEHDSAWRTASHVVNSIFSLTFVVSLVAFLFAPWLIANVVAPGFDAPVQEQTVALMRILLVSTVIFSVSGIVMGILQSHNMFLLSSLAPILYDVGILFGVLVLIPRFGVSGVAYGAVLGAAMHLVIQIPGLLRARARWVPELGWNDPNLRRIVRLMIPRILDLGLVTLTTIVTTNIVSRLVTGSTSAYDWGWRIMQIPETLIGTAMGVVIFPTLAALSSIGDLDGKRSAMSGALRFILIGTIPSAIGLIVIGRPMISLLEGGQFDASASDLVYSTLQFFAFGIVVHSMLEVVARSFYADKDTLTPLLIAVGGAVINLFFAYTLSGVAYVDANPQAGNVGGLALANTLGITFEVGALLWVLRRRWHGLSENTLAQTALKTLAASLVMAVIMVAIEGIWRALGLHERGTAFVIAQLAVQSIAGAAVFIGIAFLLRMDELKTLIALVLRRRRIVEVAA
jgi:putative peptidoglycan lipid II flippase